MYTIVDRLQRPNQLDREMHFGKPPIGRQSSITRLWMSSLLLGDPTQQLTGAMRCMFQHITPPTTETLRYTALYPPSYHDPEDYDWFTREDKGIQCLIVCAMAGRKEGQEAGHI